MTLVIKTWISGEFLAVPFEGTRVRGLKKEKPVSAGELLAETSGPHPKAFHAPCAGLITQIGRKEIVIRLEAQAVGNAPRPMSLSALKGAELYQALLSLGLPLLGINDTGPLIISFLDAQPGLNYSRPLFSEHRKTIMAGFRTCQRLWPNKEIFWAAPPWEKPPLRASPLIINGPYPANWPPLIIKRLERQKPNAPYVEKAQVIGARELFFMGRLWRTGLPLTHLPLSLGGANYFVPVGSRIIDLLSFANLRPLSGDTVVQGGLITGTSVLRLEGGLGLLAGALNVVRRPVDGALWPPRPCRRCGACSLACPVGLNIEPWAAEKVENWPQLAAKIKPKAHFEACLKCGACALACPVQRPLGDLLKLINPKPLTEPGLN
ncbi:MAG: 4Fe-4S dicluster domain-containing protein [Candidatus Adiutrix sp.]